jgi:hypothetical protein
VGIGPGSFEGIPTPTPVLSEVFMNCLCGKPACWRIWEAPITLCQKHGRAWLASEEKKIVGMEIMNAYEARDHERGIMDTAEIRPAISALDIPKAHAAMLQFMAGVERDATLWTRIKRRLNCWFGWER